MNAKRTRPAFAGFSGKYFLIGVGNTFRAARYIRTRHAKGKILENGGKNKLQGIPIRVAADVQCTDFLLCGTGIGGQEFQSWVSPDRYRKFVEWWS